MEDHYKVIEEQLNIKKYSYNFKEYKVIGEAKYKDLTGWLDVIIYEALYECTGINQFVRQKDEFFEKFIPIN